MIYTCEECGEKFSESFRTPLCGSCRKLAQRYRNPDLRAKVRAWRKQHEGAIKESLRERFVEKNLYPSVKPVEAQKAPATDVFKPEDWKTPQRDLAKTTIACRVCGVEIPLRKKGQEYCKACQRDISLARQKLFELTKWLGIVQRIGSVRLKVPNRTKWEFMKVSIQGYSVNQILALPAEGKPEIPPNVVYQALSKDSMTIFQFEKITKSRECPVCGSELHPYGKGLLLCSICKPIRYYWGLQLYGKRFRVTGLDKKNWWTGQELRSGAVREYHNAREDFETGSRPEKTEWIGERPVVDRKYCTVCKEWTAFQMFHDGEAPYRHYWGCLSCGTAWQRVPRPLWAKPLALKLKDWKESGFLASYLSTGQQLVELDRTIWQGSVGGWK